MSGTALALTIDTLVLGESLSWNALESCMVDMSHEVPARALALVLEDAQERLIEAVCGRRWMPVPGAVVPFACPGCGAREGFVRKGEADPPPQTAHRRRNGRADRVARGLVMVVAGVAAVLGGIGFGVEEISPRSAPGWPSPAGSRGG